MPLAVAVVAAAVAGFGLGGPLQSAARVLVRGNPTFAGWTNWDGTRGRLATRLVTAGLLGAVVLVHHADTPQLVLGAVLLVVLVPLALVDVAVRLLPNGLTIPAAVVAIAAGTIVDPGGEPERLLAGLLAGGAFLVPALVRPDAMGIGDVKLTTVLGLFLGAAVAVAVFVALVAGVVVGLLLMTRKGVLETRRTAIAFGPLLALGGVIAVLAGDGLLDLYATHL